MNQPVAASVTHAYAGPEHGLIYGFVFDREGSAQPLPLEHLSAELALPDRTVWLHFNAANTTPSAGWRSANCCPTPCAK